MATKSGVHYRLTCDENRSTAHLVVDGAAEATQVLQSIFQQSGQLSPAEIVGRLSGFVRDYPGMIDGHEHLSRYLHDAGEFEAALESSRFGLEIGYGVIQDFEGRLPWKLAGNQPLLRIAHTAIRCSRAVGNLWLADNYMLSLYHWSPDDDHFEIAALWAMDHPDDPDIRAVAPGTLDPEAYGHSPEEATLEESLDQFQQAALDEALELWAAQGGSDLTSMVTSLNKPAAIISKDDSSIARLVREAAQAASHVDPYEAAARKAGWFTMADSSRPLERKILMVNAGSGLDPIAFLEGRLPVYDQADASWQDLCVHESIRAEKDPVVEFRAVGDMLAPELSSVGETVCGPFGGHWIWVRYLPHVPPRDDPAIINIATHNVAHPISGLD